MDRSCHGRYHAIGAVEASTLSLVFYPSALPCTAKPSSPEEGRRSLCTIGVAPSNVLLSHYSSCGMLSHLGPYLRRRY